MRALQHLLQHAKYDAQILIVALLLNQCSALKFIRTLLRFCLTAKSNAVSLDCYVNPQHFSKNLIQMLTHKCTKIPTHN